MNIDNKVINKHICYSVQLDLGLDSWYLDLGFKTKGKSFVKHFNVYLSLDMLTIILYYEDGWVSKLGHCYGPAHSTN